MGSPRWLPAEDAQLESLLGDVPWPYVSRLFNSWAAKYGYTRRSTVALKRRMEARGLRRTAEGEWITTGLVVRSVGLSHEAVGYWIKQGWLPAQKLRGRWYLRRRDLVAMARQRPAAFAGLKQEQLLLLLEDEALAADLAQQRQHPGRRRRVRCVETGRVYSSIREAACKAAYVTPARLRVVLDSPNTANGLHWVAA